MACLVQRDRQHQWPSVGHHIDAADNKVQGRTLLAHVGLPFGDVQ